MVHKAAPPHDLQAEESVLGSVLIDPKCLLQIADSLRPEDFFASGNGKFYSAMLELFHDHKPVDIITVSNLLGEKGVFDTVGGAARLAELSAAVPSASHVEEYAGIVRKKATLRGLLAAADRIAGSVQEEARTVEDLLEAAEREVFALSKAAVKHSVLPLKDVLGQRYETFAERHMAEGEVSDGIATGFAGIDKYIYGLQPTDLVVLAARPSMGKTALALDITLHAALGSDPKKVLLFNLEMSKEQLADRMFASRMRVDSWKLQKGKLTDDDFGRMGQVMDQLGEAPIFVDDNVAGTIPEIRTKARRQHMEHGLDLIVIDYLQLMSSGNPALAGNRVQEISEISRALKTLARELHVPVLALSQLSRGVENRTDKRPILSDLRESGAIEQDADVVLMMYRDDYYNSESEKAGITDIYIRKHRNGPIGHCELRFDAGQMRFYDVEKSHTTGY